MSGEAMRRRVRTEMTKKSPVRDQVPNVSGSGWCIKIVFFLLLVVSVLVGTLVYTDYRRGQLQEAYTEFLSPQYREIILSKAELAKEYGGHFYQKSLENGAKAIAFVRGYLRTLPFGDMNLDELLFGTFGDDSVKDLGSKLKSEKNNKLNAEGETKVKAEKEAKLKAEKEAKLKADKEAKLNAEKEAKLKAEKEAQLKAKKEAQLKAENEVKLKAEKEAKLKAEKEAKSKADKKAKLKAEKEAQLKADKEAQLKAEKEAQLKAEKEAKLKAEKEAKLKAEKEAKLKAEKEAKLKAEKEAKLKAEKEAKLQADKEANLKAEKEAQLKAEKEAQLKAEKEAKSQAEKEAKLQAEKEAKLQAEKEAKLQAEKEAKLQAEKEAKLKEEQEAKLNVEKEAKLKAENEAKVKAEKEAKLKAEKEAILNAEREAKIKAEKEALFKAENEEKERKLKMEQETKLKAEQEARVKAEQEAKKKAEQEAKLKVENEAKLKAEKETKKKLEREVKLNADQKVPMKSQSEIEHEAILKAEQGDKIERGKRETLSKPKSKFQDNDEELRISDPAELRSKVGSKQSNLEDDLQKKRKLENDRLIREKIDSEKYTQSTDERNDALDAARKAAEINKNIHSGGNNQFSKNSLTNSQDLLIKDHLDSADNILEYDPEKALKSFEEVLSKRSSSSPRALYGRAMSLKKLAEIERSNSKLEAAIESLKDLLLLGAVVPDNLFRIAGIESIRLLKFRGWNNKVIKVIKSMLQRFPNDLEILNELGIIHLVTGNNRRAKEVFEQILIQNPNDGLALVHLGFILKTLSSSQHDLELGVSYMKRGIATRANGVVEGIFFFHLGDALNRLHKKDEADQVYREGVELGLFRSFWQRSLYNIGRLTARPIWTIPQTKCAKELEKIRQNWKLIREEALKIIHASRFNPEAENLRDYGFWGQFELYRQGKKIVENCDLAPITCSFIEEFQSALTNTRGQVKFSTISNDTHIYAHSGPTNTRLRTHLSLIVPENATKDNLKIRVAEKNMTWSVGDMFVFDDSFDHEVWNFSGGDRTVLIVDIWHPEISSEERLSLPPI